MTRTVWRERREMHLQKQQNRNATAGQNQIRYLGVGHVSRQFAPDFDEALAVNVQTQQILDLATGDDDTRGRREPGHHRLRHELD